MELVEVVIQGVRGASTAVRWSFGAGASVVPAGDADKRLPRAIYELLAGVADGETIAAVEPGAEARVALVLIGRDQQRYRLLWDLSTGRRALQKFVNDKYEMVTTTASEISQAITAQLGFPQPDALREIFFSFADDLPSRRVEQVVVEEASTSKAERPLPPGFGDTSGADGSSDKPLPPGFDFEAPVVSTSTWRGKPEAELQARLEEIKTSTSQVDNVSDLEFELDGLQKKVFELSERRRPLQDAEAALASIDASLQQISFLQTLPEDFEERVSRLEKARVEHERDLARFEEERERLTKAADHLSDDVSGIRERPRPMQAAAQDPLVRYGIIGGVAAIMAGLAGGAVADGARYLALLDIPAFGVAAFGGIRLLSGLEEGASLRARLARVARDQKRLEDRFQIDEEQVTNMLKSANLTVEQLPDVNQQLSQRAELQAAWTTAAKALEAARAQGDLSSIADDIAAAEARMRAIEEQLQSAGMGIDPASQAALVREKAEIEGILRGDPAPEDTSSSSSSSSSSSGPTSAASVLDDLIASSPTPSSKFGEGASSTSSSGSGSGTPVDVLQRMVRLASDLLVQSIDDAGARLAPRASQMVVALTERRYAEVRFGPRGVGEVIDGTAKTSIPFVQLPPGDRDLVALALRLAVVEAACKQAGRLPVFYDQVFDAYDAARMPLLTKAVQFLAQGTQVVLVTARRELAGAGTVVQGQRPQGKA